MAQMNVYSPLQTPYFFFYEWLKKGQRNETLFDRLLSDFYQFLYFVIRKMCYAFFYFLFEMSFKRNWMSFAEWFILAFVQFLRQSHRS